MTNIATDVTDLIGGTPLVRINRLSEGGAEIVAKVEAFNPASSVKDRIARSIVDAAEASGELKPGGTIIEATSGNTGVALSMVGAARGYKVVIVMPSSMSLERRILIRAFGAELVLTDPKGGVTAAVAEAERIRDSRRTTTEEILRDTDENVDIFIAGVGTGGTVSGVGAVLKELKPNVKVIAVQPAESPLLTGGEAGPHGIQGLGPNFVAQTYNPSVVDEVIDIETPLALETSRRAAAEEGLLVGISSGAALAAAIQVAQRPENEGKRIVVILPDTGERYLSTALFENLRD